DVFVRILNDLLPPWNVNEIIYLPFTDLYQTLGYPAGRLKDLLEEIHFWDSVNEESLTEFAKIMNKNNPECKIFVEREEFILPE
ncbi:MAG TPA: hypothetical protein VFD33_06780, partial [Bacillota bacterium]|nr:hypothetical protein [Bacillota bacterium]